MIEHLGALFGFGKMLNDFLKWKEESKLVDRNWLSKSGFKEHLEKEGFVLCWSNPDKIESRKLAGWEIIHEIDKKSRIRRIVKDNSGGILMGRRHSNYWPFIS